MITKMRDNEIGGTVTVGQVLDLMQDTENEAIAALRAKELGMAYTLGELKEILKNSATFNAFKQEHILEDVTVADVLRVMLEAEDAAEFRSFTFGTSGVTMESVIRTILDSEPLQIGGVITVGQAVDFLAGNADVQARRDTEITLKTSVGKLLDLVGEEKVKTFLEEKAAAASYNADYEYTSENVIAYWMHLTLFIFVFALLATVTLEFIDKDKR